MKLHRPVNVLAVGLGHQNSSDYIPAIVNSNEFKLVAVCDLDVHRVQKVQEQYGVFGSCDLNEILDRFGEEIDAAVVAVPHASYLGVIKALAGRKIDIIKEKPFATSYEEAIEIANIVRGANICLSLTLQRRHNASFNLIPQFLEDVGHVHSIEAKYVMNIASLDTGWRANKLLAGGGALIDLGYHYVDLLIWHFGLPSTISCRTASGNRENQYYDVEDSAHVQLEFSSGESVKRSVLGNLVVSRVHPSKEESLTILGTNGRVEVSKDRIASFTTTGASREFKTSNIGWQVEISSQFRAFAEAIRARKQQGEILPDYLKHVAFIEACYESSRGNALIDPRMIYSNLLRDTHSISGEKYG